MPRSGEHIVIVTGDQLSDVDVLSMARVIVRFVRQRRREDADCGQPAAPASPPVDGDSA